MLPPFGFVLYSLYDDSSTALRAWADTEEALAPLRGALAEEEGALVIVAPADECTVHDLGTEFAVISHHNRPAAIQYESARPAS